MIKYVVVYCYEVPKVEKIPGHTKLEFNYSKSSGVNKFAEWETVEGFYGDWVYITNPLYNYDKRYESVGDINCAVFYTKRGTNKYLANQMKHHGLEEMKKHFIVTVFGLFDLFLVHMATRFVLKNYYKFNIYGGWPFVWSVNKLIPKKNNNS